MHFSQATRYLYRKAGQIILALATMLVFVPVQADMLVSPLRVHLDKDNQTAAVVLRNPSDGSRTYRLEWIEQRMSKDGVYSKYKEGETIRHSPASPYLRLSPRQITVPPGGNQRVRIHYRPAADMAAGEYRSHLLFRVVGDLSEPYSVSKIDGGKGMSLVLNMQLSVAIPVVVRHLNDEPPQVKITEVTPLPSTAPGQSAQLAVVLQRSGLGGSFGRLVVDMQTDSDTPVERIGISDNVSVFSEMNQRRLVLNLRERQLPAGAWLRVAYEGLDEYKGLLWDEQVFQIR